MGDTDVYSWEVAAFVVEFRITVVQARPHIQKCTADVVVVLLVSGVAWLPGSHGKNATVWAHKGFASPMESNQEMLEQDGLKAAYFPSFFTTSYPWSTKA